MGEVIFTTVVVEIVSLKKLPHFHNVLSTQLEKMHWIMRQLEQRGH